MRIFLTGVSCVGKSTIGEKAAELLGYYFFDLDEEIEKFFGISIERLQNKFLTIHSYRDEAAKALVHILNRPESKDSVIALPPSGLMGGFWRVVKKTEGAIIVLTDKPENILGRITFYDIDSIPIKKKLTEKEKRLYLREIKKDITYFRKSYARAHFQIDVCCLDVQNAAENVRKEVETYLQGG